jgi:hypothetical protein
VKKDQTMNQKTSLRRRVKARDSDCLGHQRLFLRAFSSCLMFAASLSSFPVSNASAASVSLKGEVIEVRGEFRRGDADKFNELLSPGVRILRIRSQGGDLQEALRIGQIVLSQNIEVEVAGLCASACAQLVLPGAKAVRLDDGSIVAMHAAAQGALISALNEGSLPMSTHPVLSRAIEQLHKLNDDMKAFFLASGVRADAMNFMYELTSMTSVQVVFDETSDDAGSLRLTGGRVPLCRAWLLDDAALQSLGVRANAWRPAGRFKASLVMGEKYDQIYDGQIIPLAGVQPGTTCAALRRSGTAPVAGEH